MGVKSFDSEKAKDMTAKVPRKEFEAAVREIRENITELRIAVGKIETRLEMQEKTMEKLSDKVDSFTWKFAIGVILVVAAQIILKFLN